MRGRGRRALLRKVSTDVVDTPLGLHRAWHLAMTAVLDDRFYPVLLIEVAEPFAPGELDAYFERLRALAEKSLARGRKHVVLARNTKVAMSAAGRSAIA